MTGAAPTQRRRGISLPRRRHGPGLARYLGAGEEALLVTRQHPFALVRVGIDALGLLVPLLIAAWGIAGVEALRGEPGTWILRVLFLGMLLIVARLAVHVLAWELERVVVTGEKVIHIEGVLQRRIASTPLAKVSEFTVHQPLLGRVFDYGSLVVDVPGGRDQALHGLGYLPDPASLYRLVSDQAHRGRIEEGGGWRAREVRPTASWAGQPDPWQPALEGDGADHTIRIPRVPPQRRRR